MSHRAEHSLSLVLAEEIPVIKPKGTPDGAVPREITIRLAMEFVCLPSKSAVFFLVCNVCGVEHRWKACLQIVQTTIVIILMILIVKGPFHAMHRASISNKNVTSNNHTVA